MQLNNCKKFWKKHKEHNSIVYEIKIKLKPSSESSELKFSFKWKYRDPEIATHRL